MRLSITFPESGRTLVFPIPTSVFLLGTLLPKRLNRRYGAEEASMLAMREVSRNAGKALRRYVRANGHFTLLEVISADGEIIRIRV